VAAKKTGAATSWADKVPTAGAATKPRKVLTEGAAKAKESSGETMVLSSFCRRSLLLGTLGLLGLVAGQDAAGAGEEQSFPKTIIQTSPNKEISARADWEYYHITLRQKNPHYKFLHFDDEEALAFIEEHFSGTVLHRTYLEVTPIMKADLFRLAAIYILGGFYMDMDMLSKQSFDPLIDMLPGGSEPKYGAVFPKEWWMSTPSFTDMFPGRAPQDPEDHWQVGNYAFCAMPYHPFVKDVLEETIVRSIRLMQNKQEEDITDIDILATTGPYVLTEVYHRGRKEGKYADVYHIGGDTAEPVQKRTHGGNDWHKFGPFAEHMLSHSWVKRGLQDELYAPTYGAPVEPEPAPVPAPSTPPPTSDAYHQAAAGVAAIFSGLAIALIGYIV
jgi:hypothetical protein